MLWWIAASKHWVGLAVALTPILSHSALSSSELPRPLALTTSPLLGLLQASGKKKSLAINQVIMAMVLSLGGLSVVIFALTYAKRKGWIFPSDVVQDPQAVATSDFSCVPPPSQHLA